MAFTVTFPTRGQPPSTAELQAWLTEQGEPFDVDGADLQLRAMPVRLFAGADAMQAWIEVTPKTPVVRLVGLVFSLSIQLRADVRLTGTGDVGRAQLWLRLADEQDRQRLAAAIDAARERAIVDEVQQRLWAVLAALQPGKDLRWDAATERIVELVEVGTTIDRAEANWLKEDPATGEVIARPVDGQLHILAWRFVDDAWPGLTDD